MCVAAAPCWLPCRPRHPDPRSRPLSRAASSRRGSIAEGAAPQGAPARPDGPSNEQLVWEMLYNPRFSLPVAETEAAWARAVGEDAEPEPLQLTVRREAARTAACMLVACAACAPR